MPEKERNASWSSKLTIKNPDGTEVPMAVAPTERCTMHTQPVACTHTWGEWMTQPQNANAEERRCTTCGNIEYREKPKPVTNTVTNTTQTHECKFTYTQTKAPTCTAEGSEKGICSCGKTTTRAIKAKGHTPGAADSTGKIVCTVKGCGAVIKEGTAQHTCSFGEAKVTKEPNCTEPGEKTATCSCGKTQVTKIDPKGHNYIDGKCTCGATDPNYTPPQQGGETTTPGEGENPTPGDGTGGGSPSGQSEG